MQRDDDSGDALDDVARIRPAVDRLRHLVTSATILDLKASADGYWAARRDKDDPPHPEDSPVPPR